MPVSYNVFVTGATGYIGSRLIPVLQSQGHRVIALTREGSRHKLTNGCRIVCGDALDGSSYSKSLDGVDTFVQLVGVAHPSPAKTRQFLEVDMKSAQEAIRVAVESGVQHFVYLSVAHPAPAMHAYIDVRSRCEEALQESGLNATILRPWYVLGPGHRWAYALLPAYRIAELFPRTRDSALRLGLVTLPEMVRAMAAIIAVPPEGIRIVEVPEIRRLGRSI